MDSHPLARRPHKSPAHTVKDRRNRPQRLIPCFFSFVTKVADRAAHYRVIFVSVNTLVRFFFFLPTRLGAARRSYIMRSFDEPVNTSFLLRPAFLLVRRDTVSRAAHYRGASESVNTPAHLFLFSPWFVATPWRGAHCARQQSIWEEAAST